MAPPLGRISLTVSDDGNRLLLCYPLSPGDVLFAAPLLLLIVATTGFMSFLTFANGPWGIALLLLLVGLLTLLLGLVMLFSRRGKRIDRRQGIVEETWRLFGSRRTTCHPLADFGRVQVFGTGLRDPLLYGVSLAGNSPPEQGVVLLQTGSLAEAFALAEQVSAFSGLPVEQSVL